MRGRLGWLLDRQLGLQGRGIRRRDHFWLATTAALRDTRTQRRNLILPGHFHIRLHLHMSQLVAQLRFTLEKASPHRIYLLPLRILFLTTFS